MNKQDLQEQQYQFPYHHLPQAMNSAAWEIGRALHWGYEYLGVMTAVLRALEQRDARSVLDFGCGDGRLLVELVRRGFPEVAGVDFSGRALTFARAFLGDALVNLYHSMEEMGEARFDAVVAMEVLEHIPDDLLPSVLAGIHERLVPGGAFVITVPSANRPLNRKHYRHYTVRMLEDQTRGLFRVAEVGYVHRVGLASELCQRMVVNRFGMIMLPAWSRLTTRIYHRYVLPADASNGAHLVAVLEPVR